MNRGARRARVDRSNACAIRSSSASLNSVPKTDSPIGRSCTWHIGSVTFGYPDTAAGWELESTKLSPLSRSIG